MVVALGCSDMVPPEDAWLKRKNDAIVIGCYSSRQTWHLSCQDGKWIGVLGNCSVGAISKVQNIVIMLIEQIPEDCNELHECMTLDVTVR